MSRSKDIEPKSSTNPLMSRRRFIAGATIVTVAAATSGSILGLGAINRGDRPQLGADLPPDDPFSTPPAPVTSEAVSDTTIPEQIPVHTDPPIETTMTLPQSELLVQPETLKEGQQIGFLSVVNSKGEVIIPDINLQANLDNAHYNDELHRGVIMEVRRDGLNVTSDPNEGFSRQQGVLGDNMRITTIFGHRVSWIDEDKDGDGKGDGIKRHAFDRLAEVDVGGVATITLKDGTIASYECIDSHILADIMTLKKATANFTPDPKNEKDYDTNFDKVHELRYRDTNGVEMIQLVACHPPTEWGSRLVCTLRRISS